MGQTFCLYSARFNWLIDKLTHMTKSLGNRSVELVEMLGRVQSSDQRLTRP